MLIKPDFSSSALNSLVVAPRQLAKPNEQGGRLNVLAEQQKKQQEDMQASMVKMKELKKATSPKKMASLRAGMLKQRLDTLRAVMHKLPPGNYKALAQELKQIAKELAALGKQLGGAGAGVGAQVSIAPAGGGAEDGADAAAVEQAASAASGDQAEAAQAQAQAAEAQAAQAQAQQAASQAEAAARDAAVPQEGSDNSSRVDGLNESDDADDKNLRKILTEAKQVLKELVALLKIKHQKNDKETRKIFDDIERELKELDKALGKGVASSDSAESAEVALDSSIGNFIDTRA